MSAPGPQPCAGDGGAGETRTLTNGGRPRPRNRDGRRAPRPRDSTWAAATAHGGWMRARSRRAARPVPCLAVGGSMRTQRAFDGQRRAAHTAQVRRHRNHRGIGTASPPAVAAVAEPGCRGASHRKIGTASPPAVGARRGRPPGVKPRATGRRLCPIAVGLGPRAWAMCSTGHLLGRRFLGSWRWPCPRSRAMWSTGGGVDGAVAPRPLGPRRAQRRDHPAGGCPQSAARRHLARRRLGAGCGRLGGLAIVGWRRGSTAGSDAARAHPP